MERLKCIFVAASLLCLAGCATPTEREAGLAQTAPKMTRQSDEAWYAACHYVGPGGHPTPWIGPMRSDRADALNDALEHNKLYPGHNAQVVH